MSSIESATNSFGGMDAPALNRFEREHSRDFTDFGDDKMSRQASFSRDSFSNSFYEIKEGKESGNISLDRKIRGTVENWKERFKLLSDGRVSITLEAFLIKFKNNAIDCRDKDVLSFLIFGVPPKTKIEKAQAGKYFTFDGENIDADVSSSRQSIITKYCRNVDVKRRDVSYEVAVLQFWNTFVLPFLDEEKDFDSLDGSNDGDSFRRIEEEEENMSRPGEFDYVLYHDIIIGAIKFLSSNKC